MGEGEGVTLHQFNTLLIILQAELELNTSCQTCFICLFVYLFVCLCLVQQAIWMDVQVNTGMHHTFTRIQLPT